MDIVVLQGSPNRKGSTRMMVDAFAEGAREAGHMVHIVEVATAGVRPCGGCVACGYEGPCIQHDGMDALRKQILASDMLVFATPLYYYGMTGQLKCVVDRCCSFNSSLHAKHLQSALLAVAWNRDDWTFDALEAHYKTLVRYLNLRDRGEVLGYGCGTPQMTERSGYLAQARALGARL